MSQAKKRPTIDKMSKIHKRAPSNGLLWLNVSALTLHGKPVLDADQRLSVFAQPLPDSIKPTNKRDIKLNTENRFSHLYFP